MRDPSQSLEGLLARIARQDRDAFHQLYKETSPKLFAVAVRILGRSELAEEVLQDAFLTVWNRADRYRSDIASPLSWMVSITRNRAIDVLRKRTELPLSEDGQEMNRASELPDPYELTAQSSELRALLACMEGIDAKHQKCILMAYYYGYTHDEIASKVGVPTGTVKSWLSRGLKRIRDCLNHG